MALSLAPYGVRVNAVGPGSIMTPVLAAAGVEEAGVHGILSRTPLARIGDPLEVGQVRSPCSPARAFLQGHLGRAPSIPSDLYLRSRFPIQQGSMDACSVICQSRLFGKVSSILRSTGQRPGYLPRLANATGSHRLPAYTFDSDGDKCRR